MNVQVRIKELKESQQKFLSSVVIPKEVLDNVKNSIINNFDITSKAYKLDNSNSDLSKEKMLEQFQVNELEKSDTFKNEYGKVCNMYMPYGILGVKFDCDVYNALRLMVLSIVTRNALIIDTTNNIGSIYMLINEFNNVLNKMGLDNLIEIYHHNEGTNLEDIEELDGMIYIGKRTNAERIRISFNKPVIYSGCGNYELYVEDNLDNELIQKASLMGNIKIYSKKGIEVGQEISGIEEAIARINDSGSEYGVGIITKNRENAKRFVNEIKARNVFANALPTLTNNLLDLTEKDLLYKKSVLVYE